MRIKQYNRICFCIFSFLISCSYEEIEENKPNYSKTECTERRKFDFPKHIHIDEIELKEYLAPRDSVLIFLSKNEIKPIVIANSIRSEIRYIYYVNGKLSRIYIEFHQVDGNYFHDYIILDNCHWIYEKSVNHWENLDSLFSVHHYSFNKKELEQVFVMSALSNFNYYTNLKDNFLIQNSYMSIVKNFQFEIEFYVK